MKRYRIELSEEQMELIADCLDDVCRFAMGQCRLENTVSNILKDLVLEEKLEREHAAQEHLKRAKRELLPELSDNAYKRYNATEFIGNLYQISRTMMHRLTVDNEWGNTYLSPALPSGNMGTIKVEQIKE